ncbi:Protein ALP1-like [Frankliniella fusca]|uniref:Protein ALP1-like n=1 Tax=Frankliniella fusca TaxID=407009 RepID=A0AAE1HG20_9NEOP|nr:Protein ALP1-like [Frankliniella fusca]
MAGVWFTLIPMMREFDLDAHFNYLRMTPDSFDWLLQRVEFAITKQSFRRETISAGERLAVTLRYLASGDSQASLSYAFRISDVTVSRIVVETTAAIWFALKDTVFEPLNEDFWRRKSSEFESMWNFPMCVGAMDGKHYFGQKFPMMGSECYNYKFGNSLILFAISDAKYKFIMVDVGSRGRESDGGVFHRSDFGKLFVNRQLCLPPAVFNSEIKCELPYVFLGDAAFPADQHLLRPFDQAPVEVEEMVFNYRLSRARRVIENAFGILAARFRILRSNIIASETLAQNIILACVALHNLHLLREDSIPPRQRIYLPPGYADIYKSNGKFKKGRWRNEHKETARSIFNKLVTQEIPNADVGKAEEVREKFMELFVTEPLPWQCEELPTRF